MGSLSRRERREARADELRRADLAEAARLGAEFGLGDDAEAARVRVPRTPVWLRLTILTLAAAVSFAFTFMVGALVSSAWPGNLILGVLTPAAGAALWLLARYARSLVVWHRIYRYRGGIIQIVSGEPEPRVLRWAAVETVTLGFYEPETGPPILVWCQLAGAATTIDVGGASNLRYPEGLIRDVARDAERNLAPRIAGSLVSSYQTGEPVIVGCWRIEQAGVISNHHKPRKSRLIPWGDVGEITVTTVRRRGDTNPPDEVILAVRHQRLPRSLPLSGVPNGMFLPHLLEYIAGQHGLTLRKGHWPASEEP